MTEGRKSGDLPLDICAEDSTREFDGLEAIDDTTPEEEAQDVMDYVEEAHEHYRPFSFWEAQDCYVQLVVEKIGLKSLFAGICAEFRIPNANAKGWGDLNIRASMMRRFKVWEAKGKQCVLLYCGDFDPVGLKISDTLRDNMEELSRAQGVNWHPDHVIIDRFGLNLDFINEQRLDWIDGLITGSGKDMGSIQHKHHRREYVQEYIRLYGQRKVEADAMVIKPEESRSLLRATIRQYVPDDAPGQYARALAEPQRQVKEEITRLIRDEYN